MDYHNVIKPSGGSLSAGLAAARDAFDDLSRLSILEDREGSLTRNQQDDFDRSSQRWNRAVDSWPEQVRVMAPHFTSTSDVTTLNAGKAAAALMLAIDYERGETVRGTIRSTLGTNWQTEDHVSTTDTIRDQWESGERVHDYTIPTNSEETRSISDFANSASLYMTDFSTQMSIYQRTASPWINLATVINSDNGRPIVVPTLTSDPATYIPGEGTAVTAADVTLSSVTVTPLGYKALMYVTNEAFEDEEVKLTQIIARAQARAIALAYGSAFTTTVLAGINNGGTATAVGGYGTATGAFIGYEDLINLQLGRAAPYRGNGTFVMSNGMIGKARKWRDGQGQYLWPFGGLNGQPDSIAGAPVYEDPYLATPASATKSVVYGDASAALIVKMSQLRVELSRDFKFDQDVTAIKTVQRIGLAVQDASALAFEVSANT